MQALANRPPRLRQHLDRTDQVLVLRGRHGHTQRLVGGGRRSGTHAVLVASRRQHTVVHLGAGNGRSRLARACLLGFGFLARFLHLRLQLVRRLRLLISQQSRSGKLGRPLGCCTLRTRHRSDRSDGRRCAAPAAQESCDGGVALGLCDIEGCEPIIGSQVEVCASMHEQLDYVNRARVTSGDQRRDAVDACLVDGGVGGKNQLHAAAVALDAGGDQRRGADAVCLVDDSVGGEQQLHAATVAFVASGDQRRDAVAGCLVDGGVGVEQQLRAAVVAFAAGGVQRRDAIAVCLVDGGVGGE